MRTLYGGDAMRKCESANMQMICAACAPSMEATFGNVALYTNFGNNNRE